MDQNGNYIVQKIALNTPTDNVYHQLLYDKLKGMIFQYAIHKHGCRVIQTAFEVFNTELRDNMIYELNEQSQVIKCLFDFNANHVMQKIFTQMG